VIGRAPVFRPVLQTGVFFLSQNATQHEPVVLNCDANCPLDAVTCSEVDPWKAAPAGK
jgi:hypothetical protein